MAAYGCLVQFATTSIAIDQLPWLAFVVADMEDLLNDGRGRAKMKQLSPRERIMTTYMAADIIHAAYVTFFKFLTESVYQSVEDSRANVTGQRQIDTAPLLTMYREYMTMRRDLVRSPS